MKTIPEILTQIRTSAGLTQGDIGAIIGKTAGAICNYEKGRRDIKASDFEKIKYRLCRITKVANGNKA